MQQLYHNVLKTVQLLVLTSEEANQKHCADWHNLYKTSSCRQHTTAAATLRRQIAALRIVAEIRRVLPLTFAVRSVPGWHWAVCPPGSCMCSCSRKLGMQDKGPGESSRCEVLERRITQVNSCDVNIIRLLGRSSVLLEHCFLQSAGVLLFA